MFFVDIEISTATHYNNTNTHTLSLCLSYTLTNTRTPTLSLSHTHTKRAHTHSFKHSNSDLFKRLKNIFVLRAKQKTFERWNKNTRCRRLGLNALCSLSEWRERVRDREKWMKGRERKRGREREVREMNSLTRFLKIYIFCEKLL